MYPLPLAWPAPELGGGNQPQCDNASFAIRAELSHYYYWYYCYFTSSIIFVTIVTQLKIYEDVEEKVRFNPSEVNGCPPGGRITNRQRLLTFYYQQPFF